MPDDIRFVLEAPHVSRTQKKRPRLVTSCDTCRTKKIKCIQKTPNAVCEACVVAGEQCRFNDRERYYAERRAAQAVPPKSAVAKGIKRSSREPETPIPLLSHAPHAPSTQSQGGPTRPTPRRAVSYHPYRVSPVSVDPLSRSSPESDASTPPPLGPLFDPQNTSRPHSQIMLQFIQAFFDHLNPDFPFLAYDETIRQFLTQSLTPLLANCIAAHAVCFVDIPEVTKRGIMHVSDQYCDNAKALILREVTAPSMDTLHALILLSWAEYNRYRYTEFCFYGQRAISMAHELGFSEYSIAQMAESLYDQKILQSTWDCVKVLDGHVRSCSLF
ncbi:hypothetical protein PHLGIDRAFT_88151 [Phlebiopsis gigantea 11061_1 CR5-6]|uniref:Zn(2)-C6 fungal-type domain-containing protein n=1 Tax=Phlebiopsis gigantea (strain 11061_1 CR5-6) TaxID=745531 RepID=A0A0C3S0N4_PHLG1|nr:hypothetical protein PHLGIDRAFT_88151 [Phlebiopsis gigantea 11061_1 CR5-6]